MSQKDTNSNLWNPQERTIAISLYETMTYDGISTVLKEHGYNRSPKAVERFFARVHPDEVDVAPKHKIIESTYNPKDPLYCSWDEKLLIKSLRGVEFGDGKTSVVPVVVIPDTHARFHDPYAIELACKIIDCVRPVALVYLGDDVDFAQISRYAKDPRRILEAGLEVRAWQEDVDKAFASAARGVKRYKLLGNHEKRLYKYYCERPEIMGFAGMQMDAVIGLDRNFNVIPNLQIIENEIIWRNKFLFKHGDITRKFAGWSAKAELEKEGMSGISGHTHRAASYVRTIRDKSGVWTEGGCLCQLTPEYMEHPNWQQAITVIWFNGNGKTDYFHVDLIPFAKYQAVAMGNFFEVKKRAYNDKK